MVYSLIGKNRQKKFDNLIYLPLTITLNQELRLISNQSINMNKKLLASIPAALILAVGVSAPSSYIKASGFGSSVLSGNESSTATFLAGCKDDDCGSKKKKKKSPSKHDDVAINVSLPAAPAPAPAPAPQPVIVQVPAAPVTNTNTATANATNTNNNDIDLVNAIEQLLNQRFSESEKPVQRQKKQTKKQAQKPLIQRIKEVVQKPYPVTKTVSQPSRGCSGGSCGGRASSGGRSGGGNSGGGYRSGGGYSGGG